MDKICDIQQFCGAKNTEIAKLTGVPSLTWSRIFSGHQRPSMQTIYKASKALGWSEEEIIHAIARRQQISSQSKTLKIKAH